MQGAVSHVGAGSYHPDTNIHGKRPDRALAGVASMMTYISHPIVALISNMAL